MIDAKLIDKVISKSKKRLKKLDLITNVFPRTFPKGQSIEIINNSKLYSVLRLMNKSEKENVTEYFYNNNKKFKIMNFKYKKDYSEINMTVDYKKDLNFIRLIDKKFNNNVTFNKIINYILIYKI